MVEMIPGPVTHAMQAAAVAGDREVSKLQARHDRVKHRWNMLGRKLVVGFKYSAEEDDEDPDLDRLCFNKPYRGWCRLVKQLYGRKLFVKQPLVKRVRWAFKHLRRMNKVEDRAHPDYAFEKLMYELSFTTRLSDGIDPGRMSTCTMSPSPCAHLREAMRP